MDNDNNSEYDYKEFIFNYSNQNWIADGSVRQRLIHIYKYWQCGGMLGVILSHLFPVLYFID